jgi:hypothetical protein
VRIKPREVNNVKLDFEFIFKCMTLAFLVDKPWLSMHAYVICMSAICIDKQMDSHIELSKTGEPFGSRFHFEILGDHHWSM